MKILITGATGLVGTKLISTLISQGYDDLTILTRDKLQTKKRFPFPLNIFEWAPEKNYIEKNALNDVDVVFHLAGENVADGRWSKSRKQKILDSRVLGTKLLMETISKLDKKPKKFISSSAIGIYGSRPSEILDESSTPSNDFLATVCSQWEAQALNHQIANMESTVIRTGIVLSASGGALKKMLPPFLAGVGGTLGNGKQYMSWIHVDDLVRQFIFVMVTANTSGIFNGVAPEASSNKIFTKTLGQVIKRPTIFPVPIPALKILFGEMANILIADQNVAPTRFVKLGFKYLFSTLKAALSDCLQTTVKGEHNLAVYQWIAKSPSETFQFFSNEMNLEKITPPFLQFKVLNKSTTELTEGTLINYDLKVRGVKIKWQSKITKFEKNKVFIDEQIIGPYKRWHHIHNFYSHQSGTLIHDNITYKVPFGVVGNIFISKLVESDVKKIFDFRTKTIEQIFKVS